MKMDADDGTLGHIEYDMIECTEELFKLLTNFRERCSVVQSPEVSRSLKNARLSCCAESIDQVAALLKCIASADVDAKTKVAAYQHVKNEIKTTADIVMDWLMEDAGEA